MDGLLPASDRHVRPVAGLTVGVLFDGNKVVDLAETLTGAARDLFLTIGRCPVIAEVRATGGPGCPCRGIVELQSDRPLERHTAEPWLGHIDRAPILFVSSNPGWSDDQGGIADGTRTDKDFIDKFINFFDAGKYSVGGIRGVGPDGKPEKRWVPYWASTRARATELLGTGVVPGESYALTEVVHCNSRTENAGAVREAMAECAPRYLDAVLEVAAARLIVVVGDVAASTFLARGIDPNRRFLRSTPVAGRERAIVFLPHPSRRGGRKSFAANVPEHLDELRRLVQT